MIQLKSAIDKIARLVIDKEAGAPAWGASEAVRDAVDGDARRQLLEWGTSPGRKALLIGAAWPRLAADLAEREMFVTVVEPDLARARKVSEDAGARGLLSQITVSALDFKDRTFEPAGFNLVVAWEALERYDPIETILEKLVRELKTGGRLYIRARTKAPAGGPAEAHLRRLLPIALSALAPATSATIGSAAFLGARDRGLDAAALEAAVTKLFVVEKALREHVILPDAADLAATVVPSLLELFPRLRKLDATLVERHPSQTRTLTMWAKKERELGTAFRVQ